MPKADFFDGNDDIELVEPGVETGGNDDGEEIESPAKVATQEDEDEVEVEKGSLYEKPTWKDDPAKKLEKKEIDDVSVRVGKRIAELTAAGNELKRQLEQERAEKDELSKFAQGLEKKLRTGNIATLEKEAESQDKAALLAERDLRDALSTGDVDKVTDAQKRLAQATVNVTRVKERIADKKEENDAPEEAPKTARQSPQAPPIHPNAAAWLQRNAWFDPNGGDALSKFAIGAHYQAIARDAKENSPEYFEFLDKSLRSEFPDKFGVAPVTRKPTSPVPPSSRVSPAQASAPVAGTKLRMSQEQFKAAQRVFGDKPTNTQLKYFINEINALESREKDK